MADLSNFVYAEDTAHATGDRGLMMLGVENEDQAAFTAGDKDYTPFAVTAQGNVIVSTIGTSGLEIVQATAGDLNVTEASAASILSDTTAILADTAAIDTATGNTDTATTLIATAIFVDDTATHATGTTTLMGVGAVAVPTDTAIEANDIGMLAMSLDRRLHVDADIVTQSLATLVVTDDGSFTLAANDGVDIGDVDVTSGPTGATAFQVQGTAADGAAGVGNPVLAAGEESGGNVQSLLVDSDGHLQVDILTGGGSDTPGNPVSDGVDGTTPANIAVASPTNVDSVEAAAKKLVKAEIWSTVAFKARLYKVDNSVEATDPFAVGGAPAYDTYTWDSPHRDYVVLGTSGGADTFRAEITNLDDSQTADFYVVWSYED